MDLILLPYYHYLILKNKEIFSKNKVRIDTQTYNGIPHTGAAMLALKSEIYRRTFLRIKIMYEIYLIYMGIFFNKFMIIILILKHNYLNMISGIIKNN